MKSNRDVNHNSSPFTQHRKLYPAPGPLPHDMLHSPAQTKMFSYKGQRKLCTKYRLLLLCLVIFILLSVIMASLFIWQVHMNSRQSQTAPQFIKVRMVYSKLFIQLLSSQRQLHSTINNVAFLLDLVLTCAVRINTSNIH